MEIQQKELFYFGIILEQNDIIFITNSKHVFYTLNRYFIYTDNSKGLIHFRFTCMK